MLQRLGLAATVVGDPELLLLDEPASALDPAGRREVLDLIAQLRGRATVVLSSHILADVQEVCDTVGILRAGRLLFQGPLEQPARRPGRARRTGCTLRAPVRPVAAAPARPGRGSPSVEDPRRLAARRRAVAGRGRAAAAHGAGRLRRPGRQPGAAGRRPGGRLPGADLMNLWRLEWLRLVRTRRLVAILGVYVFFGLTGPLTARYLGADPRPAGHERGARRVPAPQPADGIAQFVRQRLADRPARRRDGRRAPRSPSTRAARWPCSCAPGSTSVRAIIVPGVRGQHRRRDRRPGASGRWPPGTRRRSCSARCPPVGCSPASRSARCSWPSPSPPWRSSPRWCGASSPPPA